MVDVVCKHGNPIGLCTVCLLEQSISICDKCGTTYKPGERHACALKESRWLDEGLHVGSVDTRARANKEVAPRIKGDSAERKMMPIAEGVLDYFPDALAEVARLSWAGNEKHNKGQDLHWSRAKSGDHANCVARHLIDRGTLDTPEWEGGPQFYHDVKLAWRALANLQEFLEKKKGLPISRGSK